MKYVICKGCGFRFSADSKLCPRCGKLSEAAQRVRRTAPPQGGYRPTEGKPRVPAGTDPAWSARSSRPAGAVGDVRRPSAARTVRQPERFDERQPTNSPPPQKPRRTKTRRIANRKLRIAARAAAVLLCIAVIGICGHFLQITRVRLSDYPFTSKMRMTYSSYGKAIDNYFEDGSWSVNLFSGKCTYKGTSKHGEEYEMVFTVRTKVKLSSLTIDGEKVDDKRVEARVMGMFI